MHTRTPEGIVDRGDDRRCHRDTRRLTDALGPERRDRIALLDERDQHRWHVGDGRNQVVGERGIPDDAIGLDDLLHDRETQALGDPALDLTDDRQWVQGDPDILSGGDLHHSEETKFRVDIDRRINGAAKVGAHRTSMLQDLEKGRGLEIDALLTAVQEMGRMVEAASPTIDMVLALVQQLGRSQGLYPTFPGDEAAGAP